jgi:hypothetical protein
MCIVRADFGLLIPTDGERVSGAGCHPAVLSAFR